MTLLVRNLEKSFGMRVLFRDVSFSVGPGRKIALIGANGSGKTTLLRIISGVEEYDNGKIEMPIRNFKIGIMEQFYSIDESRRMIDDALFAAREIHELKQRMESIVDLLANQDDIKTTEKLSREYAEIEERFLFLGGYNAEGEIRKTLKGIGFMEEDFEKLVKDLSGGERSRLALAKLLISKPNLLLLDEPTNHLDVESVEWLEEYLKGYQGACLMVSHDRYFIDNVAQVIIELEDGKIDSYTGNYRDYLRMKYEKVENEWREFKRQQEEIQRLKRFIDRWRGDKRRSRQAKSREKVLQKMNPINRPKRGQKQFSIRLESETQSYTKVLELRNAGKSYAGKPLFRNLEFEVLKGEKFVITGRNGQGKSTLLRCLMGRDILDSGEFRWGGNTVIGYFAQDRIELDENDNFLQAFSRNYPEWKIDECKQFLGRLYINLDDLEKPVSSLSGGEKSKLALAILIAGKPNVMILDEPTNHLDIIASEALEMALENYDGTLILVTHDRRMMDRLADRTLYMKDGRGKIYLGNYSYMKEKQAEEIQSAQQASQVQKVMESSDEDSKKQPKSRKVNVFKQQQIEALYERIGELERQINMKHQEIANPETARDWQKVQALQNDINSIRMQIDDILREIEERERDLFSKSQ
jgi:ATP-binding cassette subfamily F protein 3